MAKKVIIINGPIGSGKSSATKYLRDLGYKTIDLDMVSNNILNSFDSLSFLEELLSNSCRGKCYQQGDTGKYCF